MTSDTTRSEGSSGAETLARGLKEIQGEIEKIRATIETRDSLVKKLKRDNIAELLTRDELVDHELYAFRNLVISRVKHMSDGPKKVSWTTPDSECVIYGSNLDFLEMQSFSQHKNLSIDGFRYGLQNGINFRLSILSPLPDSRDTPEVHELRRNVLKTLGFFFKVKQEAIQLRWPGGFLLSAAPHLSNDSFSSIKIACDRRVSVLAATKHKYVAEYVFDEVSPDNNSAASKLLRDYLNYYAQETYPILFYNWHQITARDLSVRVIIFDNKDRIVQASQSQDPQWVSWEFGWTEIDKPKDIIFDKIAHLVGAPSNLSNGPLREIVFGGNVYHDDGSQEIYFFARQWRANSRQKTGGAKQVRPASIPYSAVSSGVPREIRERLEIYRSGIS